MDDSFSYFESEIGLHPFLIELGIVPDEDDETLPSRNKYFQSDRKNQERIVDGMDMTNPYRERIDALERYLAEDWDDFNTEEGSYLKTTFDVSDFCADFVSDSLICSGNPKKKEATAQVSFLNCQPDWSLKNGALKAEEEQIKRILDETDLTLDHEEVIETIPYLVQEHKVKEESVLLPLIKKEESHFQKNIDKIVKCDGFVKASYSTYNLSATWENDVTLIGNKHFKHKFDSEYQQELKLQKNDKPKSKKKGSQSRKCYNNDKVEMEKKRAFLNAKEKKRRDELKELLKMLQLCVPSIAAAPKHVSQVRVLTEARKLIEYSRKKDERLVKELAALKKKNQKFLIKYEKLNVK